MAKAPKTIYQCSECGGTSPKWQGKCPHCGEWNTLQESLAAPEPKNARFQSWAADTSTVQSLSAVTATEVPRNPTGMGELDRVLGGGLVDGAVILLGGDPGIGKSTLLLQTIAKMAQSRKVLYVSGEESAQQVALRAQRLELPTEGVNLLAEIRMEAIQTALKQHQPEVVVIDSIQTMYSDQITSAPGSVSQVRECAAQLTRMAKQMGIAMILVGHVTKDGAIAGPRVLEHMVDTVLYFEGDQHSNYRMIRAIKNRFGAANELGVFAMTENGLKGVSNPSAIFLASYRDDTPGSCVWSHKKAAARFWSKFRHWLMTHTASPPNASLSASNKTASPCCSPSSTATAVSPASTKMCSSTPSAASKSANLPPTSPSSSPCSPASATVPCLKKPSYSAESD